LDRFVAVNITSDKQVWRVSVCLSVCLLATSRTTTDRISMKIYEQGRTYHILQIFHFRIRV